MLKGTLAGLGLVVVVALIGFAIQVNVVNRVLAGKPVGGILCRADPDATLRVSCHVILEEVK